MQKVRFGIIGFGRFAERAILPALQSASNAEVIAIQKRDISAAREKAELYRIPYYYSSPEDLVKNSDIDAVFVVSANSAHCRDTILAAEQGKHVLVEKPMAMNAGEAEQMIQSCERNNVKFMVGHMIRFSPLIERIKTIIQSGELGSVSFVRAEFVYNHQRSDRSWLLDPRIAGGGPLFDIGVHCLDTVRYLVDQEIIDYHGCNHPQMDSKSVELTNVMLLKFKNGVLGTIHSSYITSYRRNYLEIIGSHATLRVNNFTPSNVTTALHIEEGDGLHSFTTRTESITVPDLYISEIEHFSDCILQKNPVRIPPNDSLINQKILDKISSI